MDLYKSHMNGIWPTASFIGSCKRFVIILVFLFYFLLLVNIIKRNPLKVASKSQVYFGRLLCVCFGIGIETASGIWSNGMLEFICRIEHIRSQALLFFTLCVLISFC